MDIQRGVTSLKAGSGIQVMLASKRESITLWISRAFMQHATGGAPVAYYLYTTTQIRGLRSLYPPLNLQLLPFQTPSQ